MEHSDKNLNKKIFQLNLIVLLCLLTFFSIFIPLMLQKIPSPYSSIESIYWVYKQVFGMRNDNPGNVKTLPSNYVVNSEVDPDFVLTFVGNFLPINKKKIIFSDNLKYYLKDSDYFIGNFEGIITEKVREPSVWNFDLRHDKDILNLFRKIIVPSKMALSVANNHAFDFGKKALDDSVRLLEGAGVSILGEKEKPFIDIDDTIRIIGATQWLNKKGEGVLGLADASKYLKKGAYNILYPQTGYDLELYPRIKTIHQVNKLLKDFDAVVGHHPHCPQPVTIVSSEQGPKIAAYSLGTFLGEAYEKKYQYGLILKLFLGKDEQGKRVLVRVETRLIRCMQLLNKEFLVDFSSEKIGAFN